MKYSKGRFGIFFFLGDDKIMVSYKERKINGLDSSRQWFLFFFRDISLEEIIWKM